MDPVVKDIIDYASRRLMDRAGFCGVAEGPNMAMLNSDDGAGHDIKIEVTIEAEKHGQNTGG